MEIFGISFGYYDLFVTSLILLAVSIFNYYYKFYTRKNPLPAPFPLPFVGHLFDFAIYSNRDFSEHCRLLLSKYGDVCEQWYGDKHVIIATKPEYVEKLLSSSTKSKYLSRTPEPEGLKELGVFGQGLLMNHDVNTWKFNRQFFTQAILTLNFLKESVDCTQVVFNEMEEYWRLGLEHDTITDFSEWSHGLTTDIIFQMITGKKTWATASYFLTVSPKSKDLLKFDEESIRESSKLSKAFQMYIMGLDLFTFFSKWIRDFVFSGTRKEVLNARDILFKKIEDIIQEKRNEIENTPKDKKLRYDMLTLLVTANTERSISDTKDNKGYTEPLTDEEIRGILVEALGGGVDTTANVFSFAIYYLARHPDVKSRLYQEIDNLFQHQDRSITYDDLSHLNYCEAVIKEVTRMMTTAPFISRISSESDLMDNVERDAGTRYIIYTPGIHLSKDHWKEPEKFDANRFLSVDEQEQQSKKNNSFIMWGGGLRQCPGRRLAMIELKCMLALTFRNWDIELVDTNAPLKYDCTLVRSAKDLNVTIRPRNKVSNTQLA